MRNCLGIKQLLLAMKKSRLAKKFLEELRKTPVVSAVCAKLNLSRQTVYRWYDTDSDFRNEYDICISQGRDNINDLAESKLITKIQDGESRAIEYWLDNNSKRYIKPRQPQSREPYLRPIHLYFQPYTGKYPNKQTVEVIPEEEKIDEPEILE